MLNINSQGGVEPRDLRMSITGRRHLQGQVALEFLAFMAIGVAMLAVSLVIYSFYSAAATGSQRALEAEGTCLQVASFFSSIAALGDGTSANFSLARPYAGERYNVRVAKTPQNGSMVRVDYDLSGDSMGVGCRLPAADIANGSGSTTFTLARAFMLRNTGGKINVTNIQ